MWFRSGTLKLGGFVVVPYSHQFPTQKGRITQVGDKGVFVSYETYSKTSPSQEAAKTLNTVFYSYDQLNHHYGDPKDQPKVIEFKPDAVPPFDVP